MNCVPRMTKEPSNGGNKGTRLREWRVVLMRSRGEVILMPEERNQQNQQGGQGGQQQQQGGGGQEGQELKPKPGRGREQHQFESPNYQPQPGHGSPDDPGSEDVPSTGT